MNAQLQPASPLATMLLSRGDAIYVDHGRLVVVPASGLPVPDHWLEDHGINLVIEILQHTGQDGLIYLGYTTGKYGKNLAGGVTLQFKHLLTGFEAYSIFNADLTRSRSTKNGKAGEPLPDGQFHVVQGSSFIKFWDKSGAKKPLSNTEYYKRMGNLKVVYFTGEQHPTKQDRLLSCSIQPLEITFDQVIKTYNLSDNSAITERQLSDNSAIRASDKETLQPAKTLGLQADSAAGEICYGKTVIRKKVTRDNVYPISIDDKAITKTIARNYRHWQPITENPENQTEDEWYSDWDEDFFYEHGYYL